MMPTKMMMIMSVMMSVVMLVFVDLGKCSAKSSAVEEGDIIKSSWSGARGGDQIMWVKRIRSSVAK